MRPKALFYFWVLKATLPTPSPMKWSFAAIPAYGSFDIGVPFRIADLQLKEPFAAWTVLGVVLHDGPLFADPHYSRFPPGGFRAPKWPRSEQASAIVGLVAQVL